MENDKLLHKWVNGDLTAEELKKFKQRPEYDALTELYHKTDHLTAPEFDEEGMLAGILKTKKSVTTPKIGRRRLLSVVVKYAAAAAVLLLIGLFLWPNNNSVTLVAGLGEQKKGELPDGSTFILNAESSLAYNPDTWAKERTLQLRGEVFLEVEKGSPFKVETINGLVEVLGTSFNVWSRKQGLKVNCYTGKVAVSSLDKEDRAVISKNESVSIQAGQLSEVSERSASRIPSWTEGVTKFRNVALKLVIEELERQFNTNIESSGIAVNEIVSCNFEHSDLNLALKTCLSPLGIRYEIQADQGVVLFEK